jgi:hypothetical protein
MSGWILSVEERIEIETYEILTLILRRRIFPQQLNELRVESRRFVLQSDSPGSP